MSVCMYARTYVYTNTHRLSTHVCLLVCLCVYVYMYAYVHERMCTQTHSVSTHV